ncbi:MAG: ATP-binding cassette domain-containing protein, partial [Pseudomonadota bacterium]
MIHFDQVSMRYDEHNRALKNVSFGIDRNEMVFLTGHSGAGKSTLLKLIMLMERATQGNVFVDDVLLNNLPNKYIPLHRQKIGA